jgi:hypothetical protein
VMSIVGARPGIDGLYNIEEVEHNYTRGVGFTTRCNVRNPRPTGGYESWVKAPPDNFDESLIPKPDIPKNENILTDKDLWRWHEVEKLREEVKQARTDGLVPMTRDELPSDGKVPPGYVLVGPPPDPKAQSTDTLAPGYVPAPPISGEQTYTAEDMERARQLGVEEMERQKFRDETIAKLREEQAASDALDKEEAAAREQELAKEVGDLLRPFR